MMPATGLTPMQAAFKIFDQYPGAWEIRQTSGNVPAQQFWKKVIHAYTNGNYTEKRLNNDQWNGPVQIFENGY